LGEEPSLSRPASAADQEFRALFDAHAEYVMKSLRRLGVRPGDVEDLAHEVFLTVLRKLDTYDRKRPVRPWLFAFALRFASAYRQSAYVRREQLNGEEPEVGGDRATSEQVLIDRESSQLVYRALDAMDDDKRIVFTMFELDERPAGEIAHELGIPQNTVFSRLRAARETFSATVKRLAAQSAPRPPLHMDRSP
jgi:RNA polymerase sigma-70 factor, ECF subfamily